MENSRQYLKDHNIVPIISFKDGKPHTVILLKDEISTLTDAGGKEIEGISIIVKENGEDKKFFTSSAGLISRLAEIPVGETVKIQLKNRKTDSGFQSYYDIVVISQGESDIDPDEIPF